MASKKSSSSKSRGKGAKPARSSASAHRRAKAKTRAKVGKKAGKKAAAKKRSGTGRKQATRKKSTGAATKARKKSAVRKVGGAKKATRKTVSRTSKTTAKGATKATSKTPAKRAAGSASKATTAAGSRTRVKTLTATGPTSAAAKASETKARTTSRRRRGWPTQAELIEMPTEEVWKYYRRVVTKKPVDPERLQQLRNALMELHHPLVRHIAERLLQTLPKSIELDDLISAGLFGLMDAIRGFDHKRGIKFKTYCTTRIRGSILDQLRSQDWVPRLVRLKAGRIEKALQRLQGEYGREPTHAELASTLEMNYHELSSEMSSAHAKTMFSLSDKWEDQDENSSMEKVEVLEDQKSEDPIGEINRRDVMQFITRSLTHKERFIIEQYYQVGHTMREIGEMLSLTESRVCQIHSNVMSRLKGVLGPRANLLMS